MRKLPNLNAIVYFEAVARHARINLAASELMVSPSAVSQQIKAIEETLGVRLFRRVKRRLVLTEEGERFYTAATKSLGILRDAQNAVSRERQMRTLLIRVSASFGVRWLGPRIADFVTRYPEWDLHVDATSEITDFEKENVDLEIRYDPVPPPGLHSELLIRDRTLPLCSPALKEKNADHDLQTVLTENRLLHTVKARVSWTEWLLAYGYSGVDGTGGLKFDRSSMSLQAARDGLGIVLETATLAMDELKNGTLVPLAPECGTIDFPAYHLICPARHLNRRAVKEFSDWVGEKARQHETEKDQLLDAMGCRDRRSLAFDAEAVLQNAVGSIRPH